jgi:hypothetical protein
MLSLGILFVFVLCCCGAMETAVNCVQCEESTLPYTVMIIIEETDSWNIGHADKRG